MRSSCASPSRPIGVRPSTFSTFADSAKPCSVISVWNQPGAIALTVIRCFAHSIAICRVAFSSPAFEAT